MGTRVTQLGPGTLTAVRSACRLAVRICALESFPAPDGRKGCRPCCQSSRTTRSASGPGHLQAVPRPLVDRQWRALRATGWTLRGLTEALDIARANSYARTI